MELTIALNRYDRHVPFFTGMLAPPRGLTLRPLEVGESAAYRDGGHRHARMINDLEFDIAEMSLSTFIMAVGRDPDLPLVGIPAFPRRFFSAGQIYVNIDSDIDTPRDLIGRTVGLHSFQTTLSLLAKGDLKLDYDVRWQDIRWVCMRKELIPVDHGDDVTVTLMPDGKDMGTMLCEGEIDALISPQPGPSMLERPDRYRRLFSDVHAEEVRYFRSHGYYPIKHLMVCKRELAEQYPELPCELVQLFNEAKAIAYSFYNDSNYSLLADGRTLYEQQRADFGDDPWPNGFKANRRNLERFIEYSHDQRLIPAQYPPERLFHVSTHVT